MRFQSTPFLEESSILVFLAALLYGLTSTAFCGPVRFSVLCGVLNNSATLANVLETLLNSATQDTKSEISSANYSAGLCIADIVKQSCSIV
jgi:hypothetical protein